MKINKNKFNEGTQNLVVSAESKIDLSSHNPPYFTLSQPSSYFIYSTFSSLNELKQLPWYLHSALMHHCSVNGVVVRTAFKAESLNQAQSKLRCLECLLEA